LPRRQQLVDGGPREHPSQLSLEAIRVSERTSRVDAEEVPGTSELPVALRTFLSTGGDDATSLNEHGGAAHTATGSRVHEKRRQHAYCWLRGDSATLPDRKPTSPGNALGEAEYEHIVTHVRCEISVLVQFIGDPWGVLEPGIALHVERNHIQRQACRVHQPSRTALVVVEVEVEVAPRRNLPSS